MKNKSSKDIRAQSIRNEASAFASVRLARGNLRIQGRAFATSSEWAERRRTHSDRLKRINKHLK